METIEIILFLLAGMIFGYLLRFDVTKLWKKTTSLGHKQLDKNPFETSEDYQKQKEIDKISNEILIKSCKHKESFLKVLEEKKIPDDIATTSVVIEILKKTKTLYFDELLEILASNYGQYIPKGINLQRRENSFITEEEIIFATGKLGLKFIFPLIRDENFEDGNSLKVFQKLEENVSTDYMLVKYFCESDGKNYWDAPEAESLIISALIEIYQYSKNGIGADEKKLVKHFSEEYKIIEDIHKDFTACFLKKIESYVPEKLAKIYRVMDIEEEYRCINFLRTAPKQFKFWLENTSIISSDNLFKYLTWNNILPEKFKDDERYDEVAERQKEYPLSRIDLNQITDTPSNVNLIMYIKKHGEESNFVENCLDAEEFVPCLFWYKYEKEDWIKMTQEDAEKLLDKYHHDAPYLHLGYILEGYELDEDVFDELCENNIVEAMQVYFNTKHKEYFS